MKNIIVSFLSVIGSFMLCIYSISTHQLWICGGMIIIGIIGILVLAYLRSKNLLKYKN